jgi:O-phosphoseryl-tRNA(Cys) synthetase
VQAGDLPEDGELEEGRRGKHRAPKISTCPIITYALQCRYSEELGKWIEVGNSGMFRPEMLRPMGMPEDVNVIAWGLSLERPTMILYGIANIRDLFGHKVSLNMVKKNPMCRLGF